MSIFKKYISYFSTKEYRELINDKKEKMSRCPQITVEKARLLCLQQFSEKGDQ